MSEIKNPDAPATDNQIRYLTSLVRARDIGMTSDIGLRFLDGLVRANTLTKQKASDLINEWKDKPFRKIEITPGYYVLDADIYIHVKENRAKTGVYAERLVNGKWEYVRGLVNDMSGARLMTEDEIAEFGHETGRCFICQATLTDPVSVTRGIGPVCKKRLRTQP